MQGASLKVPHFSPVVICCEYFDFQSLFTLLGLIGHVLLLNKYPSHP